MPMDTMKPHSYTVPVQIILCVLALVFEPSGAQAASPDHTIEHTLKVSLFGQPCVLRGPVDDSSLKLIDQLSPEQLSPDFSPETQSSAGAKKALEKIHAIKLVPALLESYRDRLVRRLEAEASYVEALSAARKSHSPDPLLVVGKKYLDEKSFKTFESAARQLEKGPTTVFDTFNDGIEADPQEEFHRALRKMKVQYDCAFESEDDGESE